jgi:trimethylamine--corrinoid protein Co-methyltransferase
MPNNRAEKAVPSLNLLSEKQIQTIYAAGLKVLQNPGLRIHNHRVLSILDKAGCSIDNDVARIPEHLVERSLNTAPKTIQLYTREGEPALKLGEDISYYGAGAGAPFILDSTDGRKRLFIKRDVEQCARVQDALPNLDFVMAMGEISGLADSSLSDIHQFQAMLLNTSKPINFMAASTQSTLDIIEMASVVAGGEDKLKEKPFIFLFGVGPTPPLTFEEHKLERHMLCAEKMIPMVSLSAGGSGGTAPMTGAGHLVCMVAELLTVVVISQVCRQGAPIIVGGMPLMMDMRTTIFSYGAPEFYLNNLAITEIIRSLGLPVYGTAGISDAKTLDEQAAIEATASSYIQLLSRANLIHDVGFLDSAMIGSMDMLVMTDEIIGMAKRFAQGIIVDDEHLALEVIHAVGPGGHFMSQRHTLNHFRETWQPDLITRDDYEKWSEKGSKRFSERTRDKVMSILENHKPVEIPEDRKMAIQAVISRREAGYHGRAKDH